MFARSSAALLAAAFAAALVLCAAGCGRSDPAPLGVAGHGPRFQALAAESSWGSIAAQLGGGRVAVRSVLADAGIDPHSYQPSAADARAVADASVVVVNGLGYDAWASQLLQASPSERRVVLDVGRALGLHEGANPHRWYYPRDVRRVAAVISSAYARVDPQDAAYFAARRAWFERSALARYDTLRAQIRARYAGTAVGYSESIFQGLGEDLGLRLLTPYGFVKAIAEGTDVTASDKAAVDAQVRGRRIALWVYNSQNATPDVERVTRLARANGIPVIAVTETLDPPGDSFEQWQVRELEGIERELRRGGGALRR